MGAYLVFISHAGPQKGNVAGYLRRLLGNHINTPFVDRDDLRPGGSPVAEMEKACKGADVVVFIVTEDFFKTPYTLKELRWALETHAKHPSTDGRSMPGTLLLPRILTVLWPRGNPITVTDLGSGQEGRLRDLLEIMYNGEEVSQETTAQNYDDIKQLASFTILHGEADGGVHSLTGDDDQVVAQIAEEVRQLLPPIQIPTQLVGRDEAAITTNHFR